jgi:hypothetical protein
MSPQSLGVWAHYASQNLDDGHNSSVRGGILDSFKFRIKKLQQTQEQRNPVRTYETLWGKLGTAPKYVQKLLSDKVGDISTQEIPNLSQAQRELIALYALTVDPSENKNNKSKEFTPHIKMHKFVNRLHNARTYKTGEDWLESAAMVVEVNGTSAQDWLKYMAKTRVDTYLDGIELPNEHDFAVLSDIITDTVYINATDRQLFQDHPIFFDFDRLIFPNILIAPTFIKDHFPFSHNSRAEREKAVTDFFLEEYPKLYYQPDGETMANLTRQCAEVFAIYMAMHPATDGNGTMIHALIDHALKARRLRPISAWNSARVDKPLDELRQWIQGNTYPLEKWFENNIFADNGFQI